MTDLVELKARLLRWTAPHPDWEADAEPESPADWPRDVGSVLYEARGATVLIDPLVPADIWPALDARVRGRGLPVHVLTTIHWHARNCAEAIERYDASTQPVEGVEPFALAGGETAYWLPEHRALVPGDRLIGDGRGAVRMCPASWLKDAALDELRETLVPVAKLPIELVVVSHGEPVLTNGRDAVAAAIR